MSLTDEKIDEIWADIPISNPAMERRNFARAIEAEAGKGEPVYSPCRPHPVSSSTCNLGTKGCSVFHNTTPQPCPKITREQVEGCFDAAETIVALQAKCANLEARISWADAEIEGLQKKLAAKSLSL
jgi:hypothetical protein